MFYLIVHLLISVVFSSEIIVEENRYSDYFKCYKDNIKKFHETKDKFNFDINTITITEYNILKDDLKAQFVFFDASKKELLIKLKCKMRHLPGKINSLEKGSTSSFLHVKNRIRIKLYITAYDCLNLLLKTDEILTECVILQEHTKLIHNPMIVFNQNEVVAIDDELCRIKASLNMALSRSMHMAKRYYDLRDSIIRIQEIIASIENSSCISD
ncbi:hypothetical protein ECANGB1_854 [Enterospora canceri]|uniref:Uncharacterized protein n=1 Tax=Enterospora canceri TaxID=1081671 RepID=A0A1Y1S7B2_9MICR|nr:hypothetical protein ECANGB1_854 [Enterospora canceri]